MAAAHLENEQAPLPAASSLAIAALHAASPIVLAFAECDEELRLEALGLFKALASGELDEEQRTATTALLADILFPHADTNGLPGLDLAEAEQRVPGVNPEAEATLQEMDREETDFANRLRQLMDSKGMTQAEVASAAGIGQPAVSMMLNRACRPQKRTVIRFAQALGVEPNELWPGVRSCS